MKEQALQTTLLELVQTVQHYAASDEETVSIIIRLINSRRVVLCGNFAGQRIVVA